MTIHHTPATQLALNLSHLQNGKIKYSGKRLARYHPNIFDISSIFIIINDNAAWHDHHLPTFGVRVNSQLINIIHIVRGAVRTCKPQNPKFTS